MTRFAFYGRVSTEDQQDPAASRAWQLSRSRQLIGAHGGEIVEEFFDIGLSRSLPWKRRPEATRLLEAMANPRRGWSDVVIGEPSRAFYGAQFALTMPLFEHHGVTLWVPEVGGPIDPDSEAHDLVMSVFGGMSKGERMRIKVRVRAAMESQAATEGRFLGGRPPYGYVLADAGAHPNPSKAAAGQQLRRLEIDPTAAPVVRRIFESYIGGMGLFAIAEMLTGDGIPSPSGHDPARNRHRQSTKGAWSKYAVRAILQNPRYTGRQVWGRQRKHEVLVDLDDVGAGHQTKMRWNDRSDWIQSAELVHEPIVSAEVFAQAEAIRASHGRSDQATKVRRTTRPYVLRRMVRCGACGRAMEATWNNGRAHYRCRFPAEYAATKELDHPRTVYLREDRIVPVLDDWLARSFDPENLDVTLAAMLAADEVDPTADARVEGARRQLAGCDSRLRKHRAALEAGADPVVVAGWMAEVQEERAAAERLLATVAPREALDEAALRTMLADLGDMREVLAGADPRQKAEAYAGLGLQVVYHPDRRVCSASVTLANPCSTVGVGGGT